MLLQRDSNGHERAVYHIAQSLTDPQRNYSQLEKEALDLVTAVERFHKFVWVRKFIFQTDHKPLVALLQINDTKALRPTSAARLKHWALRLMGYDFKIEYIRTQDFGQADALSRLIEKFQRDNAGELQVASIRAIDSELLQVKNLSIDVFGTNLRKELRQATKEDPVLCSVCKAIKRDWKTTEKSEPFLPFKKRAEELTIIDDTLLLGDRVVIPDKLRPKILTALHKGHPGIRRMKQLAREYVYWPKMSNDIEHLVRRCDSCALNQKLPRKMPLEPWPLPSRPLERVHMDYAGPINGQYLLIFVDAYSKFLEVTTTPTISAHRTVELCREIFSRSGPPEVLVTDHGTQFTSELFSTFCKEMQITHLLSMVNHPQSNGQAERMVDTVKRAIAKDPTNWKKQMLDFLYSYRYTPSSASIAGKSLAELFLGRRLNCPFTKWFPKETTVEPALSEKQRAMKEQFSSHHGARPRILTVGGHVVVLPRNNKREHGVIQASLSKTRYSVRLANDRVIERHINHIWKGGSAPRAPSEDLSDDWISFYDILQTPPEAPRHEPPPDVPVQPVDQEPEAPTDKPTTSRPARTRKAPSRLVIDPSIKSYCPRTAS